MVRKLKFKEQTMNDTKNNALDSRLDAIINETEAEVAPDVLPETRQAILENMQKVYANTMLQNKFEMRLALASGDTNMQMAVRTNMRLLLAKLDEIALIRAELDAAVPGGNVSNVPGKTQQ